MGLYKWGQSSLKPWWMMLWEVASFFCGKGNLIWTFMASTGFPVFRQDPDDDDDDDDDVQKSGMDDPHGNDKCLNLNHSNLCAS